MDKVAKEAALIRSKCIAFGGTYKLTGVCAIASFALKRHLKKFGIECEVVKGVYKSRGVRRVRGYKENECNHSWVIVEGLIVDITATQFNIKDEVHIVPVSDRRYKAVKVVERESDMPEWHQKPSYYLTKKILRVKLGVDIK